MKLVRTTVVGVALTLLASCSNSGSTSSSSGAPTTSVGSAASTSPTTSPTATASPGSSTAPATSPATTPATAPPTTVAGAVDPNAPEVVEPGDIPDNQVFIAYTAPDGTYAVKVPEGWARTETNGAVTFTDKYNSITLQTAPAAAAPTVDSVKASGLADVSADPTFHLIDVQPVTRKSGDGVLATYEIGSSANPVTGKKALLAVDRYVFFHNGTDLTMSLSGAKGADNVDPWKIVSDSVTWA